MFDALELSLLPLTKSPVGLSRFWTVFRERDGGRPHATGNRFARWRVLPHLDLVLSQYVTDHSVGVFIRGLRGVATESVSRRLQCAEPNLERGLGVGLGRASFPFCSNWVFDTRDDQAWPWLADWLHAQADRYAIVLDLSLGPSAAAMLEG